MIEKISDMILGDKAVDIKLRKFLRRYTCKGASLGISCHDAIIFADDHTNIGQGIEQCREWAERTGIAEILSKCGE